MQKITKNLGFFLLIAFLAASCSKREIKETGKEIEKKVEKVGEKVGEKIDSLTKKDTTTSPRYVCMLNPTKGNTASGKLAIWRKGDDLYIQGEITGLKEGKHGFHIHEKGDCSAPDASSAGGHFNPTSKEHGKMSKDSHMGDMENIKADEK